MILCMLVAQSYLPLYDPMDCSLPGSSVPGFLQRRILEWVGILLSRGYSPHTWVKPESPVLQTDSLPSEPPGKPNNPIDIYYVPSYIVDIYMI